MTAISHDDWKPMASTAEVKEHKLTVAEVAKILRVAPMTVYREIHTGALRSYKVGRNYRIPLSAVREYLGEAVVGGAA